MPRALQMCIAGFGLAVLSATPAELRGVAHADSEKQKEHDVLWPQISYSIAVGSSDGALGHMWAGAGAHGRSGQFLLVGAEFDFRNDGNEIWLVGRLGQGQFARRALAPSVALYALSGVRVNKRRNRSVVLADSKSNPIDAEPIWRFGLGVSIPAVIELACLGIPSMVELGVDTAPGLTNGRGFIRAGWNF